MNGIVVPPDADWQVECRVALTEAERLTGLITARFRSSWERTRTWHLFWWQVGLGFLVAAVAVLLHAARVEKGGIIVVAAFLACRAAMQVYARAVEQGRRRYRSQSWQSDGYAYTVSVRPDGVRMASCGGVTEMHWPSFSRAEAWGTFVVLWMGRSSPVAIPVHSLPPGWQAAELVAQCTGCIERARPNQEE